jgi:FxLD family lantipeptide
MSVTESPEQERQIMNAAVIDPVDIFTLGVRVTERRDNEPGAVPCDTSNGCPPTCASACNSAV